MVDVSDAGGRVALQELRRAAPDGQTLCLTPSGALVIHPWLFANLGFDPLKDFSPISRVTVFDFAITAGPAAPAGDIKARRIEHRPAGVDANPYLVAATVLAGIRHGMKHRIDPGPETTGNGYEGGTDAPPIPVDWRMAIDAAQRSDFLKDALGEDMHRTFTAIKAAEYARVMRTVSDVDYDLYLYTV